MKLFDLKYKERMKNHSSPVDTEQLWKDIQKRKRTKRGFIFWWTGMGLLLAMAGLYYFLNPANKADKIFKESQPTQTVVAERNRESNNKANLPINPDKNEKLLLKQSTNLILHPKENMTELTQKFSPPIKQLNQNKSRSIETMGVKDFESTVNYKSSNTGILKNSGDLSQANNSQIAKTETEIGIQSKFETSQELVHSLPVLMTDLNFHSPLLVLKLSVIPNPKVNLRPQAITKPWYLQIGFGQDLVNRNFNTNSDSASIRNTKVLYALKSEISLSKTLSKQFELFSGIRYTHIVSQNRGSFRSLEELVIPNGQIIEHISLAGTSSFSEEDKYVRRVTTTRQTSYQRMYLLDWNLGVNYTRPFSTKWAIFANAAIACNLFSRASGHYLTKENRNTEIQNEIKSQLGFSVSGGVGVSYLLTNRNAISLSVNCSNYFNSFNRNSDIQEKYNLVGAQLSYKFKL
ncbi:MAG: hypothetical protein IPI45_12620 [Saprospiraceae bacterium]|nr:hypothetical protein [Saprospiraceae bacterium]MBK7738609.1 hypothetical protein [Saprospiraceae bacterium]MBK7912819.1 hypothetical protein [Saprospiraceae bacterium]